MLKKYNGERYGFSLSLKQQILFFILMYNLIKILINIIYKNEN